MPEKPTRVGDLIKAKWFIRDVMWYDGSFSPAGDLPCVARLFACAN